VVKNGEKYKTTREVKKGDQIEVQFMTEDNNIHFGLFLMASPEDKSPKAVMPSKVHESHELSVWLDIEVQDDGIFVFEWDNSSSWLRNKHLTYLVRPKEVLGSGTKI